MKLGLFMMPSHPPERDLYDAHQWDLDYLVLCDELGYDEAWIGEHFTTPWEPIPAPDIMIAQALMRTKRIKLATGVHLLPFHHPVELAHRIAYLDHLSQGRFMLGIGSSGLPSDCTLFDVDMEGGEHRQRTRESLEMMKKIWAKEGPSEYRGNFWKMNIAEPMLGDLKVFLSPLQKPHPPIGVAAGSFRSPTLTIAGENGYIPMSLAFNIDYVNSQWEAIAEGAERGGLTPSRKEWRLVRDVYVADTDEQAREEVLNGATGRAWREYLLPLFGQLGFLEGLKLHPDVPDEDVTVEYVADNFWLTGSPETVAGKLRTLFRDTGGFGGLLMLVYDYMDSPDGWNKSTRLLAEEVMPMVSDLTVD